MRTEPLAAQIFGANRKLAAAMDADDFHDAKRRSPGGFIVGACGKRVKRATAERLEWQPPRRWNTFLAERHQNENQLFQVVKQPPGMHMHRVFLGK